MWEVNNEVVHKASQSSFQLTEQKLRELNPGKKILAIFLDDSGLIQTRTSEQGLKTFKGATRLAFDHNGVLVTSVKQTGVSQFLLDLHRNLLWTGWGKYLIGLIGLFIALTVMLGFKSISKYKKIVWAKTDKLKRLSTHINIGKFTMAWILLLSLTGSVLSFNSAIIGFFIKNLAGDSRQIYETKVATVESLQKGFEASNRLKSFEIDFIAYPNTEFSPPDKFVTLFKKDGENLLAVSHASDGALEKILELPWYLRLLIASEPLHFGNFAGVAGKLLWTLMSLLVLLIPVSGYKIFLTKKRRSKLVENKKFHIYLRPKHILFFLGAYQIMTLGSLGEIHSRTGISLSHILSIYGFSILVYFFMTKYAHNFISRGSHNFLYLLGGIGLLSAACFIAIAIFYSNSIIYFVLSRASFALLASFVLPLQNSISFDIEGVREGQLSDSVVINLGRLLSLLSMVFLGAEFSFTLFLVLLVNFLIFSRVSAYKFERHIEVKLVARYIPIIFTALNSMVLTYILFQTQSLGKDGFGAYLNILLFSSFLVVMSKTVLMKLKLQNDPRVLIIALISLALTLPFVGDLVNVFIFVFFFSLFVALTPHHYSAYLGQKNIDNKILSSEINSLHILGNALGAIAMAFSIKFQIQNQLIWTFAIINAFALLPVIKKEILYANSQ